MRSPNQLYVVEKRHHDGRLDLSDPQPPHEWIGGVKMQEIYDYWFNENPGEPAVSQEEVRRDFAEKGWIIREKTW